MIMLVRCCGYAANACALLIKGVDVVSKAGCDALSGDDDALAGIAVRSRCLACEHACNADALGVKRHMIHTTCSRLRKLSGCAAKLIKLISQRDGTCRHWLGKLCKHELRCMHVASCQGHAPLRSLPSDAVARCSCFRGLLPLKLLPARRSPCITPASGWQRPVQCIVICDQWSAPFLSRYSTSVEQLTLASPMLLEATRECSQQFWTITDARRSECIGKHTVTQVLNYCKARGSSYNTHHPVVSSLLFADEKSDTLIAIIVNVPIKRRNI
jgi:hypothetical protein